MPWLLHYRIHTPDEDDEFRREYELLTTSADVAQVRVVEPAKPDGIARALEVWFEDELFRTEDPALLLLRNFRQPPPVFTPPPTREEVHQRIIQQAIGNTEGRRRLAHSLIEPLRRRIDYQGIARRALVVDQLPEGALPIYDRDVDVASIVSGGSSPILDQHQVGDAVIHAVTGPPGPPRPFGQPINSGTSAAIAQVGGGLAQISGLHGMSPEWSVGRFLEIHSSPHPGNNGTFPIVSVTDTTTVWIANPSATLDYISGHTWREYLGGFQEVPIQVGVDFAWVPDPLDPRAHLQTTFATDPGPPDSNGNLLKSPEGPTGWGRILNDDFLEND